MRTLIVIIFLVLFISCKKRTTRTMLLVKDCSGTYLKFEGTYYPVCNIEFLAALQDGAEVKATYKKVGNGKCADRENIHCAMFQGYNVGDWIEVIKLK